MVATSDDEVTVVLTADVSGFTGALSRHGGRRACHARKCGQDVRRGMR